jgi:hypothetical protein
VGGSYKAGLHINRMVIMLENLDLPLILGMTPRLLTSSDLLGRFVSSTRKSNSPDGSMNTSGTARTAIGTKLDAMRLLPMSLVRTTPRCGGHVGPTKEQQRTYAGWLEYGKNCTFQDFITNAGVFRIAHKTASQRAETFLRTLNLWEE